MDEIGTDVRKKILKQEIEECMKALDQGNSDLVILNQKPSLQKQVTQTLPPS